MDQLYCLELDDEQFKRLKVSQKLDIIYSNVKCIKTLQRNQKIQWSLIGALASAIGWIFLQITK